MNYFQNQEAQNIIYYKQELESIERKLKKEIGLLKRNKINGQNSPNIIRNVEIYFANLFKKMDGQEEGLIQDILNCQDSMRNAGYEDTELMQLMIKDDKELIRKYASTKQHILNHLEKVRNYTKQLLGRIYVYNQRLGLIRKFKPIFAELKNQFELIL